MQNRNEGGNVFIKELFKSKYIVTESAISSKMKVDGFDNISEVTGVDIIKSGNEMSTEKSNPAVFVPVDRKLKVQE